MDYVLIKWTLSGFKYEMVKSELEAYSFIIATEHDAVYRRELGKHAVRIR